MKKVLFFVLCALILSCNEKVIEPPENLIPQETMINILYDLSVLNAAKNTNPEVLKDNKIETMEYLYKKYTIDSVQFVKSDLYYASVPLEYENIYKAVEARLTDTKKTFEEERKKQRDSVISTQDLIKSERNRKKTKVKDSLS
ncbi:DUF4296 domain-containing protein [Spongiimicrobium salis]|uniref:DUF4296 domain-containing protein n=1 Tax=Spongiimicrobium salis TaxID=1667022 RepID=UPI00374D50AE